MHDAGLKTGATLAAWARPPEAGANFLPYGRQLIEADDLAAVAAALTSDLLTTGPKVEAFESALARATGAREAVVCANGTAALHMALRAAGLRPGEACIVPAITFVATANAVAFEGADVVFADVDPGSGLMTPQTLSDAITRAAGRRIRAILPVHLRGDACAMPALKRLADEAGAVVIEDACHALGVRTPWGPIGSNVHAAMSCFSFHPVKTITTGEGGAVTTNDLHLAAELRRARNHGVERQVARFRIVDEAFTGAQANPWWYEQHELGWNYRLADMNCALGLSQLAKLERFAARRRMLYSLYADRLAPLAPFVTVAPMASDDTACPHLMSVLLDFAALKVSRTEVAARLRGRGIGSQVHYIPVHWQPFWRARQPDLTLPGAEAWYRCTLSLPLYPSMADGDVERVACALEAAIGHA